MEESPHLRGRLEDFERRLERLENELEELAWLAAGFDGETGEPDAGPEPQGPSELSAGDVARPREQAAAPRPSAQRPAAEERLDTAGVGAPSEPVLPVRVEEPVVAPGPLRPAAGGAPDLSSRLEELERKVQGLQSENAERFEALQDELLELWALSGEAAVPVAVPVEQLVTPAEPEPEPEPEPAPEPAGVPTTWEEIVRIRETEAAPEPAAPSPRIAPPPTPAPPSMFERLGERLSRDVAAHGRTIAESVATHALAWAGGVVTLLGIVFLFVLAADRGWISPELRVGMGAAVALAVFLAGVRLRLRHEENYAALAAVGAGLAGAYATILAAAAHYDFLPRPAALVVAGVVAAVAVVTSLAWSSQIVAGLGLIGAMAVPLVVQQEVSVLGGAFVVLVAAATAIVAIREVWRPLLVVGGAFSATQVSLVLADTDGTDWRVVTLAGLFWLVYTGTGIGYQLRLGGTKLRELAVTFSLAGVALAFAAVAHLFDGKTYGVHREGLALLVVALVQTALGATLFRRGGQRDLTSLLLATGMAVGGVAFGELLAGPSLTVVWSAQAALLAFLSVRLRERRFQLASAAYLLSALGYALVVEAQPDTLFVASLHPAAGVPSVVFVALAAGVFAFFARSGGGAAEGAHPLYAAFSSWLEARQWLWRAVGVWLGVVATLYALSLSLLELVEWAALGGVALDFERGHVALSAFWGVAALAGLAVALVRGLASLRLAALVLFGLTLVELVAYDESELSETLGWLSFVSVWATVLAAAAVSQRLRADSGRLDPVALAFVPVSLALAVPALVELVYGAWAGIDLEGAVLLGLGAVYGALAAYFFRTQRDFSTLFWTTGLVLAAVAFAELVDGTRLTLLWSAQAALLAFLSVRLRERRFQLASAAYLLSALGYALVVEAQPDTLFVASLHPAAGVPSVVFVALAAGVFAFFARSGGGAAEGAHPLYAAFSSWLEARQWLWRAVGVWLGVVATLYALSLSLLELVEWAALGGVALDFERGHVALSAFWGVAALAGLAVALVRGLASLRLAALVLFGLTLVELVAYDESELLETLGWLSFVSVWATVLAAAAVSQRLRADSGRLDPVALAFVPVSLALAVPALVELVYGAWAGIDLEGAVLLGLGAVYGALAAYFFRTQRDFSTLFWTTGLVLAAVAFAELVDGTRLTLLWSAQAALLAFLSVRLRERRFQLASAAYLLSALGYALVVEAQPDTLFVASLHPAAGVPSVVFVALAAGVFAWAWGVSRTRVVEARRSRADLLRSLLAQDPVWGVGVVWAARTLALYGASLALLGLLQWAGDASLDTEFQRGHVAVSACWGLVGFALLYAGLRRRWRDLRVGGFVLFGLIVGKVFLYDLSNLTAVARALSFLAVGALLLVAGYFYQRLTEQLGERSEEPESPPSVGGA